MNPLIHALLITLVAVHAPAQVITTLKSFRSGGEPVLPPDHLVQGGDGTLYGVNSYMVCKIQSDGGGFEILKQVPVLSGDHFAGPLFLSGDTLYGATSTGLGLNGTDVSVFKLNTDGTGYTVLKAGIHSPGAVELPGVVLSGNALYGWGFKINTDGTGYTELTGFPYRDGSDGHLEVQVSGDKIFGTTWDGGLHDAGTLFSLNSDGTGYTVLVNFAPGQFWNDGAYLTAAGGTLYGVDFNGVFKVQTDGTGYGVAKDDFSSDGEAILQRRLEHSDGVLYGTIICLTNSQGSWAVFRMNTDGTGYTVLKHFTQSTNPPVAYGPPGDVKVLCVTGGAIYGLAQSAKGFEDAEDGLDGRGGTLFKMNTDGSGFHVLHEFMVPNPLPEGGSPSPLALSDGALYGFASAGNGGRRVFRMNLDGTGYTTLKVWESFPPDALAYVQSFGRLAVSGSALFGILPGRGVVQDDPYNISVAQVLRMNTDGGGFTVLKEFTSLADGGFAPLPELALAGSTLYGASPGDGIATEGRLFKLNTDGAGYAVLHTFQLRTFDPSQGLWTNGDGANPTGELTVSGNTIYGTTSEGGHSAAGTVFKLNTDGADFTVLKHFSYPVWDPGTLSYTNTDGSSPLPDLLLASNTLYGLASEGGQFHGGTLFRVNTDGSSFAVLKHFPKTVWDPFFNSYTNSEGALPLPGLALWGHTLYGTTRSGGHFGLGTIFKVNTDGTGFSVITHNGNSDQPWPGTYTLWGMVLSGSTLFGAAASGGDEGRGGIYRIDLEPTLSISRAHLDTLAVSWPSVWTDYVLQQNANGSSSLNWSNVTDTIQDDGTNKSLLVSPTNGSRFYRLLKP